ncbi:hypothetical protein E0Z10_g5602 [Xylaria hypoxylon]|uniref:DUF7580 domain-containing protein n=1 Tax=Xylaria hypoxylon TaxID=37992 RepID=A0A4Z0YVI6_9PEZI|nr:hypothetical protein E0Z10_g5602 [Xylaria hypoxylon]
MDIAGLVLGALPVAIMAVESYHKGLRLIGNYKNYPQTLQGIRRNIFIQEQQLQVTLESIRLLKPTLQEAQQRLREVRPDCYRQFIDILEHMDSITSRLLEKLDVDSNGKPKWMKADPDRVSWEWRRVKRSFGDKDRKELFDELQRWNNALRNFLEPKQEIPSDHADPLTWELIRRFDLKLCDETRENVQIVHKALAVAWSKNCTDPRHPSNVELIWQHTGPKETGQLHLSIPETGRNGESNHWQRVLISVDTKETNLTSDCTVAQGLLSTTGVVKQAEWNGHLLHTDTAEEKVIYMKKIVSPCPKFSSLPLESVISDHHFRSGKGKKAAYARLSRKERLGIAAAAVWAVLVLCGTPWLEEGWLTKEVITILVDTPTQGNNFVRPKTYSTLSYTFVSQKEPSKPLESLDPGDYLEAQIRHKTLVALGVLLIELGLNKTLNQLRGDINAEVPACDTSVQEKYMVANQVIESQELELELGESYANAVQRCIQCHFLGRESTQNFLRSAFRRQFFTGVVAPVQATFDAQITSVHSL